MLLLCLLESEISNFCAGEITNTLAKNKFAIVVNTGLDEVSIKLPYHAGSAFVEAGKIIGRPPVVEAALCVKLCALIVKAVADFMANHHADAAIVYRVSVLHAERRLLQDSRGKDDFIQ